MIIKLISLASYQSVDGNLKLLVNEQVIKMIGIY